MPCSRRCPSGWGASARRTSSAAFAFSILLLSTLFSSHTFAEFPDGWVSFDGMTAEPESPCVELVSQSSSEIVLRVTTSGVLSESVNVEGDDYVQLACPGYFHTLVERSPQLPAIRLLLAVPSGCTASVAASASDTLLFSDCVVYPVEEVVTCYTGEGWTYLDTRFAKDAAAYSRSGCYPAVQACVDTVASFRGQGVLPVVVYPLRFDPASETVAVCPDLLITIQLTGGSGTFAESIGPFDGIAERTLLGYAGDGHVALRGAGDPGQWGVCRDVGACTSLGVDYLMIVEGSLMGCPALGRLAAHRASYNGFNVAIVQDTTVVQNANAQEISPAAVKQFISDVYDAAGAGHIPDGRIGYVLLVGDARDKSCGGPNILIPAYEGPDDSTTDHWYACVDGSDWLPDLMIGRLCASDTTELRREVQKFVMYEAQADSSDPWRTEILLTSGFCASNELSLADSMCGVFVTRPRW